MKEGTKYSAKIKSAFGSVRKSVEINDDETLEDPLYTLAIAIFAQSSDEQTGRKAVDRLLASMVDWNEVRVSTPDEVHTSAGLRKGSKTSASAHLIRALDAVYARENTLDLSKLSSAPRREAKAYLDTLDGVNEFVQASVILWALGGHAIPVDDKLLAALQKADLVHPEADRAEIQAFLERNIAAAEARTFCLAMRTFTPPPTAKPKTAKSAPKATKARKSSKSKKPTTKRKAAKKRAKSSKR